MHGLSIYYDFRWRDYFDRDKCVPNGKHFTKDCLASCAEGKTTVVLLTQLDTWNPPALGETEHVFVANAKRIAAGEFNLSAASMPPGIAKVAL
jgi:hypothetical protein